MDSPELNAEDKHCLQPRKLSTLNYKKWISTLKV